MSCSYMCRAYSVAVTINCVKGESIDELKTENPKATFFIEYSRGRKPENRGVTPSMKAVSQKITWNTSKTFIITSAKSTYDDTQVEKLMSIKFWMQVPDKSAVLIRYQKINLAKYFVGKPQTLEVWYPLTVKGKKDALLCLRVTTEPLGPEVPDFRVDRNTTVGSQDYDTTTTNTDTDSSYNSDGGTNTTYSRGSGYSPRVPSRYGSQVSATPNGASVMSALNPSRAPSTIITHSQSQSYNNTNTTNSRNVAQQLDYDYEVPFPRSMRGQLQLYGNTAALNNMSHDELTKALDSEQTTRSQVIQDVLEWEESVDETSRRLSLAIYLLEKEREHNRKLEGRSHSSQCTQCTTPCIVS